MIGRVTADDSPKEAASATKAEAATWPGRVSTDRDRREFSDSVSEGREEYKERQRYGTEYCRTAPTWGGRRIRKGLEPPGFCGRQTRGQQADQSKGKRAGKEKLMRFAGNGF